MMRIAVLWSIAVILTLAALLATGPGSIRARANANDQARHVRQVDGLVLRISTSRSHSPALASPDSLGASLPERLASAVASAGLPAGVLVTVAPGAEEQVSAESSLRRQRATVVLGGLTLPQFAKILDQWRRAEPTWVVAGIEIAPESKGKPEPGSDLPIRATLGLERVASVELP